MFLTHLAITTSNTIPRLTFLDQYIITYGSHVKPRHLLLNETRYMIYTSATVFNTFYINSLF